MLTVDLIDLGLVEEKHARQDALPNTVTVCRMLSRFIDLGTPVERHMRMTFEWLMLQRFFLNHQQGSHPKARMDPFSYYITSIEGYWEMDPYDLSLLDDLDSN